MSSFAAFIRENPERARSIEQMTTYLPFLLTDGRSIVQSQAALTASRLASLIVSVCLHEHPAIQSHIVNLQRGLALSSTGTLPNGSSGQRLSARNEETTTTTALLAPRRNQQQGGDGGEVESHRRSSDQRVDDGLNDDHHNEDEENEDKDKDDLAEDNVSSPSPTVSSLFSKYTDPTSRSLIAHYKGNVGAELILLLLGEIEVLLEMSVRSMTLQRLLASHGLGSSLGGDDAPRHRRRQSSIRKIQHNAVKATLAESHAKNQPSSGDQGDAFALPTGRITRFLSGKTTPQPSTAVLHRRSRRIGWIMCFTVSIIKTILRLYLQRTTLSAAVRSMLAHVQRVLTSIKMKGRRLLCFSERQEEAAAMSSNSSGEGCAMKNNPKALAGCGVGRPVSGGLTIPRVAVEGCWPQGPTTPALPPSCDEHSAAKTSQEGNNNNNNNSDTYLFGLREYLATLIDAFHAAKPLLWTFVALVSRHPSSLSTMIKLRSGGAAFLNASSSDEESAVSPLLSLFASVPPLYMPSWRGWLTMTSLELAALGVSVWLKLSRRPVIIIGGVHATTSAAAGRSSLLLEPPMRISASAGVGSGTDTEGVPISSSSETNNKNNNGGETAAGIVSRGIDAMPMTEEKDHERVRTCLYHLTRSLIQDPYFSVVLRDYVVRYMIDGGISRIPLVGGIIGAQVMMFMLRRDASFLASNF